MKDEVALLSERKHRDFPDPEIISVPQLSGAGEKAFSFISNNKVGHFH